MNSHSLSVARAERDASSIIISDDAIVRAIDDALRCDTSVADAGTLNEAYVASPKHYERMPSTVPSDPNINAFSDHVNHYKSTIQSLNAISARLDGIDKRVEHKPEWLVNYGGLKMTEAMLLNRTYMHELYFANTNDPRSEVRVDSLAHMRLERDFGTFDDWQYDFMSCASATGNGWACTGYSVFLRRFMNVAIRNDGDSCVIGLLPVIVIDMHEHAMLAAFKFDRAAYMRSMMQELNWSIIEDRFKRIDAIDAIMEQSS